MEMPLKKGIPIHPPILVDAEHCKSIMLRFQAKRRIMYLQCSALTKMGQCSALTKMGVVVVNWTEFCYVGYVRYSCIIKIKGTVQQKLRGSKQAQEIDIVLVLLCCICLV